MASTVMERHWNHSQASCIWASNITCRIQELPFHYITKQCIAAIKAMNGTDNLEKLSLNTALKLFKLKIMSVFTYGLDLIWTGLERHLKSMKT
jgi:L-aminopeptidase/D-esterase-like protein